MNLRLKYMEVICASGETYTKGATDMDLMDLGGWKSVTMVRRYRKVVDERLDTVMDAFNKSQDTKTAEDQT